MFFYFDVSHSGTDDRLLRRTLQVSVPWWAR